MHWQYLSCVTKSEESPRVATSNQAAQLSFASIRKLVYENYQEWPYSSLGNPLTVGVHIALKPNSITKIFAITVHDRVISEPVFDLYWRFWKLKTDVCATNPKYCSVGIIFFSEALSDNSSFTDELVQAMLEKEMNKLVSERKRWVRTWKQVNLQFQTIYFLKAETRIQFRVSALVRPA